MSELVLKLYVTGDTVRSRQAIANLRRLCEGEQSLPFRLEIIDVQERPQVAEDRGIIATPCVLKEVPPPPRCVDPGLRPRATP